MIYAHIGGIPVEESLLAAAPAACALTVLLRARLREIAARRRHQP
jgi:hypothetical protein